VLHLHRLKDNQGLTFGNLVARCHLDRNDSAGYRRRRTATGGREIKIGESGQRAKRLRVRSIIDPREVAAGGHLVIPGNPVKRYPQADVALTIVCGAD
jgi:hypothetical protein